MYINDIHKLRDVRLEFSRGHQPDEHDIDIGTHDVRWMASVGEHTVLGRGTSRGDAIDHLIVQMILDDRIMVDGMRPKLTIQLDWVRDAGEQNS